MKLNLTQKYTTPVFIKRENGKKQVRFLEKWEHAKVRTADELRSHLAKENAGLALITGEKNGITVVDFDYYVGPLICELYDLCPTRTVMTPRGVHFYYQYNKKLPQGANVFGKSIDCRNDGGLVFCPPTRRYKFDDSGEEINRFNEKAEKFLLSFIKKEEKSNFKFPSKKDMIRIAKKTGDFDAVERLKKELKAKNGEKITDQMIENAKKFPIEKLIEVNRQGLAKCIMPSHEDKKPSMDCRNNYAFCHACGGRNLPGKKQGYIGDVIDVYRIINNASFEEAVRALQ